MGKSPTDSGDQAPTLRNQDWVASSLVGPLTALLIYLEDLHKRRHQLPDDLRTLVENSFQQAERACEILKQRNHVSKREAQEQGKSPHQGVITFSSTADQKPLTPRERQVLGLVFQGFSNKSGARVMKISPRTFESHRAEAFRKVGAKSAADLVRGQMLPK
jgi:DNA-binding NarL/FixJ family response regulator